MEEQFSLGLIFSHPPEILNKPIQATQMLIKEGTMTGQQLLAWNVLLKNAKEQHEINFQRKNGDAAVYRIQRSQLNADMGYASTNKKPLREALKKMQTISVEWDVLKADGNNIWESCVLLPWLKIDNEFVHYSFVEQIKPMLFNSPLYSRLDIAMQRQLKFDSSKKLYDWLSRYKTNPSKRSNESEWEIWRSIIHGEIEIKSYLHEYKIFKRDKLLPAIKEINKSTDLEIELIEDKKSTRKVVSLQFKITEKPKFEYETKPLPKTPTLELEIKKEIAELGLTAHYKRKVLEFPHAIILANIDYVKERLESKSKDTIQNIGAYLLSACAGNYAKTGETIAKVEESDNSTDLADEIVHKIYEQRTTDAIGLFNEYPVEKQDALLEEYNVSQKDKSTRVPIAGKRENRLLIPFFKWVGLKTWGEPTPTEIVKFALAEEAKRTAKKNLLKLKFQQIQRKYLNLANGRNAET